MSKIFRSTKVNSWAKITSLLMLAALMIFASAQTSQAVLNAVDPGTPSGTYTLAYGFFPIWYQDTHGRGLELCLSTAASVNGPLCVLLANPGIFDPDFQICFPGSCESVTLPPDQTYNFPDESFWFAADGAVAGQGVDVRYVAAVEAAFGGGIPLANDQVSFARIRIVGSVTTPGTYIVTHPYGEEVFEVPTTGNRAIAFARDIGIGAPGDFTGALKGDIGPFLTATTGLITVGTEQFIGDPNIFQTVTGSPFGTNFLRVQGPGIDIQSDQFALAGKIYAGALPTPLIVDRTTYSRTATLTQIDVFATSAPAASVSFTPPTSDIDMGPRDPVGRFFGQALQAPGDAITDVTVTATLNPPPVSILSNVTDVVTITRAEYSLSTGTLVIEASSSDETALPTLTATGFGNLTTALVPPTYSGSFTATIPPAEVTVTSAEGGSDTEDVVVIP